MNYERVLAISDMLTSASKEREKIKQECEELGGITVERLTDYTNSLENIITALLQEAHATAQEAIEILGHEAMH